MSRAKPTPQHIEWADMEIGVLIHYLMEIYNPEFMAYKTEAVRTELSPDKFNPTKLDPEQWVRSAYELGAKYAVLVTNHCDGFSLWQTEVNDYSVASMKWKNGKGDVLTEFIEACKKYGLKPGVYYSTGCNGYYGINDELKWDYKSEQYQNYVKCVERQVEEIWSKYGKMFEIWFDGGIVPKEIGGPDIFSLLKKYQPDAIAFQGPPEHPHNIRWVGNENGFAPENCWSTYNPDSNDLNGQPDGTVWAPAETDFPNRTNDAFGGGWAWCKNEEDKVRSSENLLNCYLNSVGRNSNMLIGMAISTDGDFQDEEQFIEFGKLLKKTFGKPITEMRNCIGNRFSFKLNKEKSPRYLTLCEDITDGHNILDFTVFADKTEIYHGECIGHKRIIPIDVSSADELEITINKSYDTPCLKTIALY